MGVSNGIVENNAPRLPLLEHMARRSLQEVSKVITEALTISGTVGHMRSELDGDKGCAGRLQAHMTRHASTSLGAPLTYLSLEHGKRIVHACILVHASTWKERLNRHKQKEH